MFYKNENKKKGEIILKTKAESVQEWLLFERIYSDGLIKMKNGKHIKILKVIPVNYNLKSNLEKEAIINSYKNFLKVCNFDIQIIIQSKKENLSKHISSVKKQEENETNNIAKISENYIQFLNNLIQNKKSASKNFYILINSTNDKNDLVNNKNIILEDINDKYLLIKESLARCRKYYY